MSKIGKFLAQKKGKASVKAFADAPLLATPGEEAAPSVSIAEILIPAKPNKAADEWGADSDNEASNVAPVVVGGHLNLITEEEVSSRQQKKGPRTWGEKPASEAVAPSPEPEVSPTPSPVPEKVTPAAAAVETPAVAAAPKPYVPPGARAGGPSTSVSVGIFKVRAREQVDVHNPAAFPDLAGSTSRPVIAPSTASSAPKRKKERRVESESSSAPAAASSPQGPSSAAQPSSVDLPGGYKGSSLNFLSDLPVSKFQYQFDEDASRLKFAGRRKRLAVVV